MYSYYKILTLLNISRFKGLFLILFFIILASAHTILLKEIREYRISISNHDYEMTHSILNIPLTNTSGEKTIFRDLISKQNITWIYFFSPSCRSCRNLADKTYMKPSRVLIYAAFTPVSFLSDFKKDRKISAPLFSLRYEYGRFIGVSRVPVLIMVDRYGNILEKKSDQKDISEKLIELTKFD